MWKRVNQGITKINYNQDPKLEEPPKSPKAAQLKGMQLFPDVISLHSLRSYVKKVHPHKGDAIPHF
jgi:hypothetical protein